MSRLLSPPPKLRRHKEAATAAKEAGGNPASHCIGSGGTMEKVILSKALLRDLILPTKTAFEPAEKELKTA